MKRKLASSPSILAAFLALIFLSSCTKKDGAAAVPKPADPGSKEVLGYLVIPSLEKALKDVSAVAERFAPGKVTPESLKAQIGGMLNDPQLAGLEMQKPIVLCALKAKEPGAPPSIAAMLPVKQAAPYDQTLAAMGMTTKSSGGVLLVSQSPEALETASKAMGIREQIAGAGLKSARLYLHVADLVDAYGQLVESQADAMLGTFASAAAAAQAAGGAPMSPQLVEEILRLEVQALLSFLRQCETAQVDLDLGARSIRTDQVLTARPGSSLATAFTSSAARPSPTPSLIQGGGFMTGTFRCDARSFATFFQQILGAVSAKPGGLFPKELIALYGDMGKWWGGTMSLSIRPGKEGAFVIEYVLDVLDEAECLTTIEKAIPFLAPGTALGDMYKAMGIEMKLEKAARQHAGVTIHRLKMKPEPAPGQDATSPAPPEMAAMMKAWAQDVEWAFVKGTGLWSNDPKDLERMIDLVLSSASPPATVQAQNVFGAGRHGYFDYDILGLMKSLMSAMPQRDGESPAEMFAGVTSTAPMVFAVTFAAERARLEMEVPLEPFSQMAKSAQR